MLRVHLPRGRIERAEVLRWRDSGGMEERERLIDLSQIRPRGKPQRSSESNVGQCIRTGGETGSFQSRK